MRLRKAFALETLRLSNETFGVAKYIVCNPSRTTDFVVLGTWVVDYVETANVSLGVQV